MLAENINYAAAMILFSIGLYTLIIRRNIIKKIIGLNIMEVAIFFFLISVGYLEEGAAAIVIQGIEYTQMVNPIPQALVLTGIVIAVSINALALSLALKLYKYYGTLNVDELKEAKQ
jgi:multicomponent Na+:H+ antiporter subunit C